MPKAIPGALINRQFRQPNVDQALYFTRFDPNITIYKGGFSIRVPPPNFYFLSIKSLFPTIIT